MASVTITKHSYEYQSDCPICESLKDGNRSFQEVELILRVSESVHRKLHEDLNRRAEHLKKFNAYWLRDLGQREGMLGAFCVAWMVALLVVGLVAKGFFEYIDFPDLVPEKSSIYLCSFGSGLGIFWLLTMALVHDRMEILFHPEDYPGRHSDDRTTVRYGGQCRDILRRLRV